MKNLEINILPQHNINLGSGLTSRGIWFGAVLNPDKKCGVILYPEGAEPIRIEFPKEAFTGRVCQVELTCRDKKFFDSVISCGDGRGLKYMYFEDERIFADPYMHDEDHPYAFGYKGDYISRIDTDSFRMTPFGNRVSFEDSIFYMLNVRGYTAHETSGAAEKGTFKGLKGKLKYIKDLGVTSIILMPVYEFNEIIDKPAYMQNDTALNEQGRKADNVNYWGYSDGYYFVPKASYSSSPNAVREFHELVESAHRNGLEVLLQFWFPEQKPVLEITEVLRFWRRKYDVDGFELIGSNLPAEDILADPYLYNVKMLFNRQVNGSDALNPNHGYLDYGFLTDMRSFLKADPNSAYKAAMQIRENGTSLNKINFIARQDTMRLFDIVSYNEKHNEDNGENGRDGSDINFSWNCGVEGPSKKRSINDLREKQIKNALTFVFMGKGAPLLYGGDEFGNTQFGNNNPYNQDNAAGYIKWSNNKLKKSLLDFTKQLINIRKEHPSVYEALNITGRDPKSYGFPDFSLHGEELWRADLGPSSHGFGVIFNDRYSSAQKDSLVYVIFNMHWESAGIALPRLKTQGKWNVRLVSDAGSRISDDGAYALVLPRSIMILETVR